jgi:hypothetical protein
MPRVFDDPEEAIRRIYERGPYPTSYAFHQVGDTLNRDRAPPWFRADFTDDYFRQNPAWLAAAAESFGATIVRPRNCILNLNAPMEEGPLHTDQPMYRGMARPEAPVWLLNVMTYSELFQPWIVPVASGLAWFYRGRGGELEYWPDGVKAPSMRVEPPLWNEGLMSDNEFTWHRVGAIGPAERRRSPEDGLKPSDMLHHVGGGAWEIRDGDQLVERLTPDEVRIGLLWKAYVFKDEDHVASFENRAMDLTHEEVVDIFLEDLDAKGIRPSRPADQLQDPTWRRLLQEVYPRPFPWKYG